ncbi:MAG: hypothetical protein CMF45_00890 [Legionellales bacterium]|nr:hypothetical protein [Legionellales bacterium]
MKDKKEFKVLLVYPNLTMMLVPSLAIGIFTNILKSKEYQVDLFDTTHYVSDENSSPQNRVKFLQAREYDESNDLGIRIKTDLLGDFRKKVTEFQPDLLMYSVVEDCYNQCLALMTEIKDLEIPHIVGGVYPTASPNTCINEPLINCIGIGEGENIITEISEAVRMEKPYDGIPGIWFKSDGKVIRNSRGPLVNLDEGIRPDFSLFDDTRFNRPIGGKIFRTVPIETYRGCPFQCTYCNSPMQVTLAREAKIGNFMRTKDIPLLRTEIATTIANHDPDFFWFVDDSFTARNKAEVFEFCDMYEEFKLPFWFNTRPETTTPEMMQRLKEVGAYRISFGIESGNEQFRKTVLKRNTSNADLIKQFDMLSKSGIAFSLNLIIGLPGETRDLVMDTVRLCKAIHGFDALTVSIFTPYAGTVLREVAVRNGWVDKDHITTHTTYKSALTMPPPYLSSDEIDGLMKVIPLYIYFPESDWDSLKKAEIDNPEGRALLSKYSEIYTRDFLGQDQQNDRKWDIDGASGCKSNTKDSFSITFNSPERITDEELIMLTMQT